MNTKRLYQSDGYAVQEVVKALSILYSAIQSNAENNNNNNNIDGDNYNDQSETTLNFDVSNKV